MERIQLRVDWGDMDVFRHVNNLAFFKYLQAARVHFWERMGLLSAGLPEDPGPMLAQSECRFLKPLYFPGELEVSTAVVKIGTSSFVLQHEIANKEAEICAQGKDRCVLFDFNRNEKSALSDDQRRFLEKHLLPENRKF